MLFELRTGIPEVSDQWVQIRDDFLKGDVRKARQQAEQLRGKSAIVTPNDYLLNIEIARACGMPDRYAALVRCAMRDFPDSPFIQLYHARVLLTLGREKEGLDFLFSVEGTLGKTHRALWGTELANTFASAGFEKSCELWMSQVQDEPDFDSPLCLYTRSCACESLRQWDRAISLARQCIEAAPDWTRARAYLAHCLLARGQVEAAQAQLAEAARRGHRDATLDIAAAVLPLSQGNFEPARDGLQHVLDEWPDADFRHWVRRTLCILLVELGDYAAARTLADGKEEELAISEIPDAPQGPHQFIPLPLIAQNKNQCVPTTVAMVTSAQGYNFDPDRMFKEMHGREGTALWQMRRWCKKHGFEVIPIQLNQDAVVQMLQHGIPLIGSLEGPFNSHVDVVCGFNDDIDMLYVRDPVHWAPTAWPWELALQRYRMHNGLFAIIDARRPEAIQTAKQWKSDECEALVDLAEAVAHAKREAAEAAAARIPDDSPAAVLRDGFGVNVVISPLQFRDRMRQVLHDESADLLVRFRAIMALGFVDEDDTLARLLEEDNDEHFRGASRRYLELLRLMNEGRWEEANPLIDRLLLRGCGIAHFWELKSDILAELGDHDGSMEALERAIELEPLRSSTREKQLERSANRLTLQEYLRQFSELLCEDPTNKGLLLTRASLLQNGPDGKKYERAAREAIRWFPRLPEAYTSLMQWYMAQQRNDLLQKVLDEATQLLPDVFEKKKTDADSNDPGHLPGGDPTAVEKTSANASSEKELPEDPDELMEIVWQPGHARHAEAMQKAIELQEAGHLKWHQVARLLACRLLLLDVSQTDPDSLLPENPPGARHWFARALCDALTEYEPPIRVALAVDSWLLRTVPNYQDYSELWFERVLLLEQARRMEAALSELRKLLTRYPAMSSALYRMGVVKYRQQDFPAAAKYFRKALKVNPGLVGAMEGLREVAEILSRKKEVLKCIRMLRRKLPYAVSYLSDEVSAVAESDSPEAAQKILHEVATDFPEVNVKLLQAGLLLDTDQIEKAAAVAADINLADDDDDATWEAWLQLRMKIAHRLQDEQQLLEICDTGLRRWPDSTPIRIIKAGILAKHDQPAARELVEEILASGSADAEAALLYLQLAEQPPVDAAKTAIRNAPENLQSELAELFSEVMSRPELLAFNEPYLRWAIKKFPDSDIIRYRLATHLNMTGKVQQAVKHARKLYERNPDNLEAARILGRCLIETDPEEAFKHLKQVCSENRAAEYLFDLARCCQIIGRNKESIKLHWEILDQNPFLSASWTNLYLAGESRERLWPYVVPMLQRGCGTDDEYFLVATVMIALELNQKLPPEWFPLAVERWAILQTHAGFGDEKSRLKKALLAWQWARPADVHPEMNIPRSLIGKLQARFGWPAINWIQR